MRETWKHGISALLIFVLLAGAICTASAAGSAVLEAVEWSWEGDGVATFRGTVSAETAGIENAVWHLELETNQPEDQGSVVFTRINDKSVRIRKQSDTLEAEWLGGTENTFEASWFLPKETVHLDNVRIRFTLTDDSGTEIASGEMKMGLASSGSSDPGLLALMWVNRLIPIFGIAAGCLWLLALIRMLIVRRRKRA